MPRWRRRPEHRRRRGNPGGRRRGAFAPEAGGPPPSRRAAASFDARCTSWARKFKLVDAVCLPPRRQREGLFVRAASTVFN
eukprot:2960469-Pyramimonas_sp.AAC.1